SSNPCQAGDANTNARYPMNESSVPNGHHRPPWLFVAFWSVCIIGSIYLLKSRVHDFGSVPDQVPNSSPPESPRASRWINQTNYGAIKVQAIYADSEYITYLPRLSQLLGKSSVIVTDPTWPRTLSELPGWEDTDRRDEVTWERWYDFEVPGRWIAVGYIIEL